MKRLILATVILFTFLTGCTPFKMVVSDPLSHDRDEYSVKGRNGILIKQKLSFGDYHTAVVKRSWTRGTSSKSGIGFGIPGSYDYTNIISTEYINKKQTLHFELSDASNNASKVFCVSRFHAEDITVGNNSNSMVNILGDVLGIGGSSERNYYVQLYTKENDRPWEMLIDNQASQANAKKYIGYLAQGKDNYYTINPIRKLERNGKSGNILGGSVGFEFRNKDGKAIAAVSMIDNGMVFLGKTKAEERFLLANACAAILLQQEIA